MEKYAVEFTRYEIARILGARALQISMDAPLLMKIAEQDLKKMNYDSLKIAETEFNSGVLPISVKRPFPVRKEEKLQAIKEDKVDDEKIREKEREIEEEITEKAEEMGFVQEDDSEESLESTNADEEQ